MRNFAAFLCLFLCVVLAGFSQEKQEKKEAAPQTPANFVIPPDELNRENPVKPTEASLAVGKKLYGYQCAMCHNENGDGKSELAESMKLKLKDYTDPAALKDMTDGALFYITEKGKGQMPGQAGRMNAHQMWSLVNYVRSFAKKPGEKSKAAAPKPE